MLLIQFQLCCKHKNFHTFTYYLTGNLFSLKTFHVILSSHSWKEWSCDAISIRILVLNMQYYINPFIKVYLCIYVFKVYLCMYIYLNIFINDLIQTSCIYSTMSCWLFKGFCRFLNLETQIAIIPSTLYGYRTNLCTNCFIYLQNITQSTWLV